MDYYYFNGGNHIALGRMPILEDYGFTGALFIYNAWAFDYFTLLARDIDLTKKIKYMVALRPYNISPQYLTMINQSINHFIMPNRLQINFIAGHIKPHEKEQGDTTMTTVIHDLSSNVDRSNYLIAYLKELKSKLKEGVIYNNSFVDSFVTTSNQYIYDAAVEYGYPMIIGYTDYKTKKWFFGEEWGDLVDLSQHKVMISINPIIVETEEELNQIDKHISRRDVEFFTIEGFKLFIKQLEEEGIYNIMLNPIFQGDDDDIIWEQRIFRVVRELTGNKIKIKIKE